MAFSYNGFGTRFYGKCDFRADNSYIMTKWVVFAYIPVIPVSSLRVICKGPGGIPIFLGTTNYAVLEQGAPHWKQVISTYAFTAFLAGWAFLVWKVALSITPNAFDELSSIYAVLFAWIFPFSIPFILRILAVRRLRKQVSADARKKATPPVVEV